MEGTKSQAESLDVPLAARLGYPKNEQAGKFRLILNLSAPEGAVSIWNQQEVATLS